MTIVSNEEAISRLRADHDVLVAQVKGLAAAQLTARYRMAGGPLGDFCESLRDRQFDGIFHSIKPGWPTDQYLAGQPVTACAAPLRATSLAGLPPALVIGAGRDPLRDDARSYAARLEADGVAATHVEYASTMHAFLNFCGVLSAGNHAINLIATELTRRLGNRSARNRRTADS